MILLSFLYALLFTATASANVIWPALFVSQSILSSFIIVLSIGIESLFFYHFLKGISYHKALLLSCVGNAASALVGTMVMALAMVGWHFVFDALLGGTFNPVNFAATFIIMYLGSCLIELFTLKLVFRYSFGQVWLPVFLANVVTYALALIVLLN